MKRILQAEEFSVCERRDMRDERRFTSDAGGPAFLIDSFQWNGDGDPAHHIIELKVPFWAEQVSVVAVDTGL